MVESHRCIATGGWPWNGHSFLCHDVQETTGLYTYHVRRNRQREREREEEEERQAHTGCAIGQTRHIRVCEHLDQPWQNRRTQTNAPSAQRFQPQRRLQGRSWTLFYITHSVDRTRSTREGGTAQHPVKLTLGCRHKKRQTTLTIINLPKDGLGATKWDRGKTVGEGSSWLLQEAQSAVEVVVRRCEERLQLCKLYAFAICASRAVRPTWLRHVAHANECARMRRSSCAPIFAEHVQRSFGTTSRHRFSGDDSTRWYGWLPFSLL